MTSASPPRILVRQDPMRAASVVRSFQHSFELHSITKDCPDARKCFSETDNDDG